MLPNELDDFSSNVDSERESYFNETLFKVRDFLGQINPTAPLSVYLKIPSQTGSFNWRSSPLEPRVHWPRAGKLRD